MYAYYFYRNFIIPLVSRLFYYFPEQYFADVEVLRYFTDTKYLKFLHDFSSERNNSSVSTIYSYNIKKKENLQQMTILLHMICNILLAKHLPLILTHLVIEFYRTPKTNNYLQEMCQFEIKHIDC